MIHSARRRNRLITTKINTLLVALIATTLAGPAFGDARTWSSGGANIHNTRNNTDLDISPRQVRRMSKTAKWEKKLAGDPWSQPTVAWGKVFLFDTAGYVYAFDGATGNLAWSRELRSYWGIQPNGANPAADTNDPNDIGNEFPNPQPDFVVARSAPVAVNSPNYGHVIYFGDQAGNPTFEGTPFNGANIYMVDADDGNLIAMTKVAQDHVLPRPASTAQDFSILTGGMQVYNGMLITGVAGLGEANPQCFPGSSAPCTFKGRVLAYDAESLEMLWETYTVPLDPGYAGASVWQSTPSIDTRNNQVFVTTGDNYRIPDDLEACVDAVKARGIRSKRRLDRKIRECFVGEQDWKDNHFDSVLALDLETGKINWSMATLAYDAWTLGCIGNNWELDCGPDMDFSQSPMVCPMTKGRRGKTRDVVIVGHKTGIMYGLDPKSGKKLWTKRRNQAGSKFPAGLVGGWQWGSACTDKTVIGLNANSYAEPHELKNGEITHGGTIVGFNTRNGRVRFETAQTDDPMLTGALLDTAVQDLFGRTLNPDDNGSTIGAPSCAGSTCFWGSTGSEGWIFASNIKTGKTVWKRRANGSVLWGGAIVDVNGNRRGGKMWFVGSGYSSFATGQASDGVNSNFWAFSIPEKRKRRRHYYPYYRYYR